MVQSPSRGYGNAGSSPKRKLALRKWAAQVGGVVGVVALVLGFHPWIVELAISPDPSYAESRRPVIQFRVTNQSLFSLRDVRGFCFAPGASAGASETRLGDRWFARSLDRKGGTFTMPCGWGDAFGHPPTVDFAIVATYRLPLFPWRRQATCSRFRAEVEDGRWHWLPMAQDSTCESAVAMALSDRMDRLLEETLP